MFIYPSAGKELREAGEIPGTFYLDDLNGGLAYVAAIYKLSESLQFLEKDEKNGKCKLQSLVNTKFVGFLYTFVFYLELICTKSQFV